MSPRANHQDDPGGWEVTAERRPGAAVSVILSVRFSRAEIAQVRSAARQAREKTSEFVRNSALLRARGAGAIEIELSPSISAPTSGAVLIFSTAPPRTEALSRAEYTAA